MFNPLKKFLMDHQTAFTFLAIATTAVIVWILWETPDIVPAETVKAFYVDVTSSCRYTEVIHAKNEDEALAIMTEYIENASIVPCSTGLTNVTVKQIQSFTHKREHQ